MAYTPRTFVDNQAPGIDAEFLNNLQDEVYKLDVGAIRIYSDISSTILKTSETKVGVGLDNTKNIVGAKLTISLPPPTYYYDLEYKLNLYAGNANSGRIYVQKPNSSDATRYMLQYRFVDESGKKVLYVICPLEILGKYLRVDWYYTE